MHQSITGGQKDRKERGKTVIQPGLQKISAGCRGQTCFDKDQQVYYGIGLRAVKKIHQEIQRRREVVAEHTHAVAAQSFSERIANAVVPRQHIFVVIEKIQVLDFAVCHCQRAVAKWRKSVENH